MKNELIWLAEITAGVSGSPTERILRVSSEKYVHNTAPGPFRTDLIDAANFRRTLLAPRKTFGPASISGGEIVVANPNGRYDEWYEYGYGFKGIVYIGKKDAPFSEFSKVMEGIVEQPAGNKDQIVFRFRERSFELDKQASPSSYDGTNSGTTGIEGTPDDLEGENKIRSYGINFNVRMDVVNTSDRIYAANHDKEGNTAPSDSIAVRMNGSDWTEGTDYTDLAGLQGGTPPVGNYDTSVLNTLTRLGGNEANANGAVTADIVESTYENENQLQSIIKRILMDAGVDSADIDIDLDTTSPSYAPWNAGIVIKDQTYKQALDELTGGAGVWYAPNRLGVYQIRTFQPPQTPVAGFKRFNRGNVAKITDYQILELDKIVSSDEGRGVPAWKITVNYKKMWTVQSEDSLALALTDAEKALYSREYRHTVKENTAILDQFPEAVELEFNTLLTEKRDAEDLADRLMTLYGVKREMFSLVANYDVTVNEAIDLGDTVTVTHPRYGLENGKDFVITGIRYNAKKYEIELELWG